MAMASQHVESFVQKFRELWASGHSAHLDLDCGGGEAWVGLRLRLGHHRAGGAQRADRDRHRRGASYARRLERRAAARTAAAQAASVAPGQAEQASQTPAPAVEASAPAPAVEASVPAPAEEASEGEGQVQAEKAAEEGTEEVADDESSETDDDECADKTVDERDHKCPDCGFFVFLRGYSLREHEHCSVAWFCKECGEEDMTVEELMAHYRNKHKEVVWQQESDSEGEIELSKKVINEGG